MQTINQDLSEDIDKWCVYVHTNRHNGKKYVGITKSINVRWKNNGSEYLKKRPDGTYSHPVFAHAINKYPNWEDDWDHEVLYNGLTKDDANTLEKELIALYKTNCCRYKNPSFGYNMTDGGDGATGKPMSDEHKKKISESNKGKIVSEETRMKQSISHKNPSEETRKKMRENHCDMSGDKHPLWGKQRSEETRKKISDANKGKQSPMKGKNHTEQTKEKISRSKKGKYTGESNPNYGNHKLKGVYVGERNPVYGSGKEVVQLTKSGEFVAEYISSYEAEKKTGINRGGIIQVCNHTGNRKIAGGFTWLFKDEYLSNNYKCYY